MSAHSPGFVGHADCLRSIDAAFSSTCRMQQGPCVCVGYTGELWKTDEPIEMPFGGGANSYGPKDPLSDKVQIPPPWKGALWREYPLAYCKLDCAEVGVQRLCGLLSEYFSHLFSVFQFIFFCRWKRRCNECGIISLTSQ